MHRDVGLHVAATVVGLHRCHAALAVRSASPAVLLALEEGEKDSGFRVGDKDITFGARRQRRFRARIRSRRRRGARGHHGGEDVGRRSGLSSHGWLD